MPPLAETGKLFFDPSLTDTLKPNVVNKEAGFSGCVAGDPNQVQLENKRLP